MIITLDQLSGKPMYEQIEDSIRASLLKGELQEDTLLPSVRQLSADVNVSAITIKRVYADLEREGYLYTIAGKGTFVRQQSLERLKEAEKQKLLAELADTVKRAKEAGVTRKEILDVIEDVGGRG